MSKRDYWPTYEWRVTKPSDQGMDTEILLNLIRHIQENEPVNSILIIKNGYIVTEGYFHPFNKDYLWQVYSHKQNSYGNLNRNPHKRRIYQKR